MMLSREDREAAEEAQTKHIMQRTLEEREAFEEAQTRHVLAATHPATPPGTVYFTEPGSSKTFGQMTKKNPKPVATHPSMFLQDVSGHHVKLVLH